MSYRFEKGREVSIIIPTYNRRELLVFTLFSLFRQNISPSRYEVIVVDGGSTDDTARFLSTIKTPYRLKVVKYQPNLGAAYSRNRGVEVSSGEIIFFMDEMIVDERYVSDHLSYHSRDDRVITSGLNGKVIITHYYSQFSRKKKKECFHISQHPDAGWYFTNKPGVFKLFRAGQVIDHSILNFGKVNRDVSELYKKLKLMHGPLLENSPHPWVFSITNSLSMSRCLFKKAGMFDEHFRSAWLEDFELGYRLFMSGATFWNGEEINCFHQEHPRSQDSRHQLNNYIYFARKFPQVDVLLCGLFCKQMQRLSFYQWDKCVSQYKRLLNYGNGTYAALLKAFHDLTLTIPRFAWELTQGNRLSFLDDAHQGFSRWDLSVKRIVEKQLKMLSGDANLSGTYKDFIRTFKMLLQLPILERDAWNE